MSEQDMLTVPAAWDCIHDWLDDNAPSLRKQLNDPASQQAIDQLEKTIGLQLPDDFKISYLIHNGARRYSGPIIGVPLMSLAQIGREWTTLQSVTSEVSQSLGKEISYPKGMIKADASNAKWIPFAGPDEENYIGLDFDPSPGGTNGQIISFGADNFIYDTNRFVLAQSFRGFMDFLAQQFANGQVEVCPDNDPDAQNFLQFVRRREDGATCNLLTGLSLLFVAEK